jgi:predicted ATPase
LETHSEHLILRFLRRIRETGEDSLPPGKEPLQPEQLAVYYVEQSQKGISLTQIRVDADGEFIDRWPKGFFSERAEELF